jgi:hypothetical protein
MDRRRLTGGEVHPKSTTDSSGSRWARRAGVASTRMTARRGGRRGAQDSCVRRWGGSSDGWRRRVWGPAAPVWKGEERISSNLGMAKLGGRSSERGKTAAVLGKFRHEGEASGGRRQRSGRRNGGEGGGPREGGRSGVGDEGVDEGRVGRVFERARSAVRLRGIRRGEGGSDRGGATRQTGRPQWQRKRGGRVQINSMVLDLFKLI